MATNRRSFLQASATAAAALTLGPLSPLARDAEAETGGRGAAGPGDAAKALADGLIKAKPVHLSKVRVTGGPLKNAQDLTAKYLLSLDPDRMMAYYRLHAGLPQKAEPYGGWDGAGRQLTGHIAGHHLSAVSYMYLATGDAQFKTRADYLVAEMKLVQDKYGDGYLGAAGQLAKDGKTFVNAREAYAAVSRGEIKSGGFDLNGLWSPWYVLHKTFAGLRDAYRHTGNKNALVLETKFATWADGILAPLSDAQVQKMLDTEHGGMNEVLADLYADTGDKRWLTLSQKFEHRVFTDALKRHQDNLSGKHGNCQIPKLIGSATRFVYNADLQDVVAAAFFWDRVAQHHSYATGGHGLAEYFGPPDVLSTRVDGRAAESCNVYNMLKLTRRMFSLRPDPLYADFHERALFNHILASIDDQDGRTSYMVPVGRGVTQEYQNMQQSFTCCVGTGMESHALHGDGLYYESADTVWVNLFAPSTAQLSVGPMAGASLVMDTGFPDGDNAKLTVTVPTAKEFTVSVRHPVWAGDGFEIKVNGVKLEQPPIATFRVGGAGSRGNQPGNEQEGRPVSTYVDVKRVWKTGDTIELTLPKTVHLEPTPDNKRVAAIMWGPLVLAGDHGPARTGRPGPGAAPDAPIPVLVSEKPVTDWVVPAGTRTGDFKAQQVGRVPATPATVLDVSLTPFYRTHRRRYSVYFDVLSTADFDARAGGMATERDRARQLEAATVSVVQPGEMQPERDFNYQSDPSDRPVVRTNGRANRSGTGWFSFDMPVDGTTDMAAVVTYLNDQGVPAAGNFQILIDGTSIAHFAPNATATGFYDAQYPIPVDLVRGKTKVTIRFEAAAGGDRIAPVFGVRMIRAR